MIVQKLTEIQKRHGYLPPDDMRRLSKEIGEPLHRLHEVASFYPLYRLEPPPAVEVQVCRDISCHLHGAPALEKQLAATAGTRNGAGGVRVCGVSCLGQCDHAPAIFMAVHGKDHVGKEYVYFGQTPDKYAKLLEAAMAGKELPHQHADRKPLGWKIDPYDGKPTYELVRRFVQNRDADSILKQLEVSGLRGMGGAGFPTFRKWATVRNEKSEIKYVVSNADESEPGTFKDRELMRRTPHLLIEGIVLAGLVTGATHGWIYIRHEFHEEAEVLQEAIDHARAQGICGDNILGSGLSFPLELFISPGGYVQGEESALLEAMEDRRGEPRNKPPFPVFAGLRGKPTVINNVETLSWVPFILHNGGEAYKNGGVNGAPGMRFVSISGDVNKPGVYEVPFGQTVKELIVDTAGGMSGGQKLKAIATSGPSGGFLPAALRLEDLKVSLLEAQRVTQKDQPAQYEKIIQQFEATVKRMQAEGRLTPDGKAIDIMKLPLDLNTLGQLGNMLGAAFVAIGDRADIVDMALNSVEFYRNESCGKCVPCRMGSQKLALIIEDMMHGKFPAQNLPMVDDLAFTMGQASICGLGQVAANPILTVMRFFREDLNKYLQRART